jgi:predicted Zn-dependent peptidase
MVQFQKLTLSNGVTLVAERHPHVRSASVGVWVRVGSLHESPKMNGASHFIEHMLFKGTERRTPLQIATVLESLGGDLNAFTDKELTCYHATVLSEHIDLALDVLSDLVLHATFPKDELERERKVLLQELSMVEDSPEEHVVDLFFKSVWKDHPLGQPVIGSRENLKAINRASLVKYYEEHYQPENIIISAAGDIDLEQLRDSCERYFAFSSKRKEKIKKMAPPEFHPGKRGYTFNAEQLHLIVGYEAIPVADPYRFDALALSVLMGGGMSSRLFQEIREKAGLAYSVDCDMVPFAASGLFTVSAAMAPRSLTKCIEILKREFAKLKEAPIADSEIVQVKNQLRGMVLMSSDQMEARQESIGRNELVFQKYVSVEDILGEIERVSADRVYELAKSLFVPEKEAVVVLAKSKMKTNHLTVAS